MNINFDVGRFSKDPRGLIEVLSALQRVGSWSLGHHREIEEIVCRTPSMALKFCQMVNYSYGVSRESERVFGRNPSIGIRYLRLCSRSEFQDEKVQKRFWRKVLKNPELALEWSLTFGRRLPEGEEVFVGNIRCAEEYAAKVIRGPFPEKVHQMIVLRSFENLEGWEKKYLADYLAFAERYSEKAKV